MTEEKTRPQRWLPIAMLVLLAGVGFFIGMQKHLLWLAIVLAVLGAAFAWLVWMMIRVAVFTALGALAGGILLAILRSKLWFLGVLAGGCLGFWAGWHWQRPNLFRKRPVS